MFLVENTLTVLAVIDRSIIQLINGVQLQGRCTLIINSMEMDKHDFIPYKLCVSELEDNNIKYFRRSQYYGIEICAQLDILHICINFQN